MKLKETLHTNHKMPRIRDGEIWWCAVGENVGIEIDGKSKLFSRPVVILKKLSRHGFIGLPLTSKQYSNTWYVKFYFQNNIEFAVLSQIRTFSVSRLFTKIGQLPEEDLNDLRNNLIDFLYK